MSIGEQTEFDVKQNLVQQGCEEIAAEIQDELEAGNNTDAVFTFEPLLEQYTSEKAKRIRGVLFMAGYALIKGASVDEELLKRPRALIEQHHTYILGIDDIQDRAQTRHGKPVTHEALADRFRGMGDEEASHYGIALALNSILGVQHYFSEQWLEISGFPLEPLRSSSRILHRRIFSTAIGQTYDILNGLNSDVTVEEVERVMRLKTSGYTVIGPIEAGLALALEMGPERQKDLESELEHVAECGDAMGLVFQLGDDRQTYEPDETGKVKSSDIAEGKKTLIVLEMLNRANAIERRFILKSLGSKELSRADFDRFVALAHSLGAYAFVKERERAEYERALKSLDTFPKTWDKDTVKFLRDMAGYFLERKT